MRAISLSREYSGAGASLQSPVVVTTDTGRSKTKRKFTPVDGRGSASASPRKGVRAQSKAAAEAEAKKEETESLASELTALPQDVHGSDDDIKFEESRKAWEDYWTSCESSYVEGREKKFVIPIDRLETPPENLNIRGFEEKGVISALNFFLNMPDPDKKLTLCAMPQNLTECPKSFKEVESGKFWMINGQHSVEASKRMRDMSKAQDRFAKFKEWECFVVWNKDAAIIRKISAYYNRVNHLQNYQPT